jgi:hypothetical protein
MTSPSPVDVSSLLPLARLIAGNVMAHEAGENADGNDAHFAAQVIDGLHDYLPQVKGALDGLQVALENDDYAQARYAIASHNTEADALREQYRNVAAIAWLMAEADADAGWAAKILHDCRNEEPYGDCTKAPITCNRCVCDEALEAADAALKQELK